MCTNRNLNVKALVYLHVWLEGVQIVFIILCCVLCCIQSPSAAVPLLCLGLRFIPGHLVERVISAPLSDQVGGGRGVDLVLGPHVAVFGVGGVDRHGGLGKIRKEKNRAVL